LASKDQLIGLGILLGSIAGIVIYFYLVFLSLWSILIIQLTAFVAVAGILAILAWIGYTLATTPPPAPVEELEKELKVEGQETGKEEGK
jgi:predicted DNA-binding transcriptional regulator